MKLPETFTNYMQEMLKDESEAFFQALTKESPVSLRLNPSKKIKMPEPEAIPWTTQGFYLPKRPVFTLDPLFHAGCYYVQEASSMFLEQIITNEIKSPVCCLDLCAAPGGKSTHLSSLLPEGSLLVSNEVIRSRANILAENLIKWGNPSTTITNNDPSEIGKHQHLFDLILADVPCSGEGMFRKDERAIDEWSPTNIALCAERQHRIISDIWPALKPGGILIYSTCTYNLKENEENILFFIDQFNAKPLEIPIKPEWQITGSQKENIPVHRFFPHRTKGEGFFIAALQKNEDEFINSNRKKKVQKNKSSKIEIPKDIYNWILHPDNYHVELKNQDIIFFPKEHQETLALLQENLRIIIAGTHIGEMKGKDMIPNHSLCMSTAFNQEAFPSYEVDKEQALQFLKKESFNKIPSSYERGYMQIKYSGHPLGFIKNIGNRANNLYPQEWRIRMKID